MVSALHPYFFPGGDKEAQSSHARAMAAPPTPARSPVRQHYRVQLHFVTEEQLFGAGPLSLPKSNSLLLEVHPTGEEAEATVTDGEVLGASRGEVAGLGRRSVSQGKKNVKADVH